MQYIHDCYASSVAYAFPGTAFSPQRPLLRRWQHVIRANVLTFATRSPVACHAGNLYSCPSGYTMRVTGWACAVRLPSILMYGLLRTTGISGLLPPPVVTLTGLVTLTRGGLSVPLRNKTR